MLNRLHTFAFIFLAFAGAFTAAAVFRAPEARPVATVGYDFDGDGRVDLTERIPIGGAGTEVAEIETTVAETPAGS